MDVYDKLGLNAVVDMVRLLGENTDVQHASKSFTYNGVKYDVIKLGNFLNISSEQGKALSVLIDATSTKTKDSQGRTITYLTHDVDANYLLPGDDWLNFHSKLALDEGFEPFKNVSRHDLLKTFEFSYMSNDDRKLGSLPLTFDYVRLTDEYKTVNFCGELIKVDNMNITSDGNKVLSYFGQKLPSMETIKSFNPDLDKIRIKSFVKNGTFSDITKEAINEIDRIFDNKKLFYKDIQDYYKDGIKDVKKAINIRNKTINGMNNMFSKEELYTCLDVISNAIYENKDYNKENVLKKSL